VRVGRPINMAHGLLGVSVGRACELQHVLASLLILVYTVRVAIERCLRASCACVTAFL
jgi:hypothetical protein